MAHSTADIEASLNELFVKKAPPLPAGGKAALVRYVPILSLLAGVFSVLSAWSLWHWAHAAQRVTDYAQQLCSAYSSAGCAGLGGSRFSFWLWLGIAFILIEGVLYLMAYPGLRDRQKAGWNYLYYGALVNVAYAIVSLFTSYDRVGHFIGSLIGSAVGFYLLFQIRNAYLGKTAVATAPAKPVKK